MKNMFHFPYPCNMLACFRQVVSIVYCLYFIVSNLTILINSNMSYTDIAFTTICGSLEFSFLSHCIEGEDNAPHLPKSDSLVTFNYLYCYLVFIKQVLNMKQFNATQIYILK